MLAVPYRQTLTRRLLGNGIKNKCTLNLKTFKSHLTQKGGGKSIVGLFKRTPLFC